jgi:hypothetical protein
VDVAVTFATLKLEGPLAVAGNSPAGLKVTVVRPTVNEFVGDNSVRVYEYAASVVELPAKTIAAASIARLSNRSFIFVLVS